MKPSMGMGIGINTAHADAGELKRHQMPIACGVWFTSTGRAIPKTIKYQDENQVYHTFTDFQILHEEERFYCGIRTIQYLCQLLTNNTVQNFQLLYYTEKKEWKLLFAPL